MEVIGIDDRNYESKSLRELFVELTRVYFIKSFKVISDKGIHPGQASLLKLVGEEPGLSQKEIAKKLNIQPPTVAVSIRRMEKSGLLKRDNDSDDKRISRVFITAEGSQLVKEVNLTTNELDNIVFAGISDAEQCLLRRILIQLIKNLRETIDEKEIKEVMQKFSKHHDKKHAMCNEDENRKEMEC